MTILLTAQSVDGCDAEDFRAQKVSAAALCGTIIDPK